MSVTIELKPHENPRIDPLTDAQRLRWVLEFIRLDLDVLTPEKLAAVGDDLLHAAAPWWVQAPWWKKRGQGQCTDMPAAAVRPLQQEIREGIQMVMAEPIDIIETTLIYSGYREQKGWVLPVAATRVHRVLFDRHGRHAGIESVRESTDKRTAILHGVVNLMQMFGDRLCTCQVCGTLFLRQYRQEYCGTKCSNKVRNKRRLDRKSDQRKTGQLVTTGT